MLVHFMTLSIQLVHGLPLPPGSLYDSQQPYETTSQTLISLEVCKFASPRKIGPFGQNNCLPSVMAMFGVDV